MVSRDAEWTSRRRTRKLNIELLTWFWYGPFATDDTDEDSDNDLKYDDTQVDGGSFILVFYFVK